MTTENSEEQKTGVKELIISSIIGLLIMGLGIAMFVNPGMEIGDYDGVRRRSGFLVRVLDFVWGIPGGIVITLFGALVIWGTILGFRNSKGKDTTPSA